MMQATHELRDILNAAEQAVGREDHAAAERLLREALSLQELNTNTQRDEIAKTLNNLAIVCEMVGKLGDAETCYRRAFKIATASLPATDPFVTTSRENLEEFCKANGLPLERVPVAAAPRPRPAQVSPPPPTQVAPPPALSPSVRTGPAAPPQSRPARMASPAPPERVVPPPRFATSTAVPAASQSSRVIVLTMLGLVVLALAIAAGRYWLKSNDTRVPVASASASVASSEPATTPAAPANPTPTPTPTPAPAAAPAEVAATPPPVADPKPEPTAPVPPPATRSSSAVTASSPVTVVSSQVCRTLSTKGAWQCASASGAQSPGTMYFYTRVASPRDTTIEHRWLRDDRVIQRVPLRIRANDSGFRTYSRNTIGRDRAGTWKVELRAQDGQLLDEQTFSVR